MMFPNIYNYEYLGRLNNFRPNAPDSAPIPRVNRYKRILMQLNGCATNLTMMATPIAHPDYPFTLIQRISLIANGKEEVKFLRGASAFYKDCIIFNQTGTRSVVVPGPGLSEPFVGIIPLNIPLPKALDPVDMMFPTVDLVSLKLEVLYGGLNDIFPGEVVTDYTIDNFYIDLWGELKTHKDILTSIFREKWSDSKELVVNNNFEIELDQLDICRLWLRGFETGADGELTPFDLGLIAPTVKIVAGNFKTDEIPLQIVQNNNFRDYGTEGYESPSLDVFPYYLLDFVKPEGKLTNTLDCRNINDPKMFLNIATVGQLNNPFIEVMYDYVEKVADNIKSETIFVKPIVKRTADERGISYEQNKVIVAPINKEKNTSVDLESGSGIALGSTPLEIS